MKCTTFLTCLLAMFLMGQTRPTTAPGEADALFARIQEIQPPPFDSARRKDHAYVQSYLQQRQAANTKRALLSRQFVEAYPERKETPALLMFVATMTPNSPDQTALYRQVVDKYPAAPEAKYARTLLRPIESIRKPFELSFTDVLTGKLIDIKSYKGRVVVIEFWATWCKSCVLEMPGMKDLYAKWHPKGVEFIGVSLDLSPGEGGQQALKDFLVQNNIRWPHYYQGNGWGSEFSRSWGINYIPRVFIVDPAGNLAYSEAHNHLEPLISQLVAARDYLVAAN